MSNNSVKDAGEFAKLVSGISMFHLMFLFCIVISHIMYDDLASHTTTCSILEDSNMKQYHIVLNTEYRVLTR